MMNNRHLFHQGRFTYLLNEEDHTAWIHKGHIGRGKRYRVPSLVAVNGIHYTIIGINIGAYNCPKTLRHLVIPDTITYVDEDCFCSFTNLRSVHIGKGVEYLLNWNFYCPKLRTFTIDKDNPHLQMVDGMVLSKDGTIVTREIFPKRHRVIPDGVTHIEKVAFWGDNQMEQITFPNTLRKIGDNSFACCTKLKSVVLPEGFEQCIVQSFEHNENLELVDLPSTLKQLGPETFTLCPNLCTMIIRTNEVLNPSLIQRHNEKLDFASHCNLFVPEHLVSSYRQHPIWGQCKSINKISNYEQNQQRP